MHRSMSLLEVQRKWEDGGREGGARGAVDGCVWTGRGMWRGGR